GRNELAFALYGQHSDMLLKDKGKDSRAAKRITDHVRRFKITAGLLPGRKKADQPAEGAPAGVPDRALKVAFLPLWHAAPNMREQQTIASLFHLRLGVPPEKLNKWTEKGLAELAVGAIDIQAISG